ncbi:YhfC family intramembrane metalloprotease [Eubacterium multiforme]|uniref:Membrane protein YhfC n=1 Tax=Eubacterium multiforme TaxID=83339 RepID=A0ABT9UX71_9FIRM|nr:YhfC family glutamic-type intramembrane protease [Eubacterium multiforme]MDQ0150912.1 putative membrane protein YhfC [Eubacterium multiforme]
MKFTALMICFFINIIISFGIPIGAFIYFIVKRKRCIKPFIVGMIVFLITQVFLRIPLLQNVLVNMDWYNNLSVFYPVLYALFLGITAGVFEEGGRYLGFKIALKNNRRWIDGIAFGFGHGGIEAILIVGLSSIKNLITLISLNNGTYLGGNAESLKSLYLELSNINVLFGGIERISAIIIHIGLTLIVLYGINKKQIRYLILAIIIHGAIDFMSGIFVMSGMNIVFSELFIGTFALGLLIFTIKSRKLFKNLKMF